MVAKKKPYTLIPDWGSRSQTEQLSQAKEACDEWRKVLEGIQARMDERAKLIADLEAKIQKEMKVE